MAAAATVAYGVPALSVPAGYGAPAVYAAPAAYSYVSAPALPLRAAAPLPAPHSAIGLGTFAAPALGGGGVPAAYVSHATFPGTAVSAGLPPAAAGAPAEPVAQPVAQMGTYVGERPFTFEPERPYTFGQTFATGGAPPQPAAGFAMREAPTLHAVPAASFSPAPARAGAVPGAPLQVEGQNVFAAATAPWIAPPQQGFKFHATPPTGTQFEVASFDPAPVGSVLDMAPLPQAAPGPPTVASVGLDADRALQAPFAAYDSGTVGSSLRLMAEPPQQWLPPMQTQPDQHWQEAPAQADSFVAMPVRTPDIQEGSAEVATEVAAAARDKSKKEASPSKKKKVRKICGCF